jgi:predicted alpha/beta hydrolase family esterase
MPKAYWAVWWTKDKNLRYTSAKPVTYDEELMTWQEKDRPLIFIAHSLGGIVVKQVR